VAVLIQAHDDLRIGALTGRGGGISLQDIPAAVALILPFSAMQHPDDELLIFEYINCWELLACANKQYRINAYPDQSALSDSGPMVLDPLLVILIRLSGTRRRTISAKR
jgi:hypothetical protein